MILHCFLCFPKFKEILGNAEIKATKTAVMKAIGQYLTRVKKTAKLIIEYAYGERGSDKAALKRDRNFEANDVLYYFKYIRVMELIKAAVGDSAAMAVLSSFQNIQVRMVVSVTAKLLLSSCLSLRITGILMTLSDADFTHRTYHLNKHFCIPYSVRESLLSLCCHKMTTLVKRSSLTMILNGWAWP